jgi:hypothetical protein
VRSETVRASSASHLLDLFPGQGLHAGSDIWATIIENQRSYIVECSTSPRARCFLYGGPASRLHPLRCAVKLRLQLVACGLASNRHAGC